MIIKNGFNGKETTLRISSNENGAIELWIHETGKDDKETLSYMSIEELHDLFQEVKRAGAQLFNL